MTDEDNERRATANFRRQHANLAKLAGEIMSELDLEKCTANASAIRDDMARFTGKLKAHTVMEEEQLYPKLRNHADPEAKAVADRLWNDFGAYYQEYFTFYEKWRMVGAIEEDPDGFIDALKNILIRLGTRMNQENDELYAMVDRLDEN